MKKVIVIGLDGFEPTIVESMLDRGELPNLGRIRQAGGYSRLRTTYPAQTPVAWSTFATGTNPGGHGIFDFLSRDPSTYLPVLALSRYEQKNAFVPPRAVNLRRGTPVWELLSEAGIPSIVLRCPCTYPPDEFDGRMLAGVGVPDLRGGLGTSTFYSSRPGVEAEHSEKVLQVSLNGSGTINTTLIGPRDPRTREDVGVPISLRLKPEIEKLFLRLDGQADEVEIMQGEWSDWLKVKFRIGLLQSVRGMVRFYLAQIGPVFELYASPINFDPVAPLFPISHPADYARELEEKIGTFYTAGMAEDHDGLNNRRFVEETFLDQCADVMREREAMMLHELERAEQGLFFCLFDTPDRLQHMFWRYREEDHPARETDHPSSELTTVIEEHYRDCDAIVGKALSRSDDQTTFIVLSDHGMNSFQRGLNLNTWLFENGFLALKADLRPGEEAGDLLRGVDWDRTRAYALGLGGIFLNLARREANGIVETGEAEALKAAIIQKLTGLRDPKRGKVSVRSVLRREQVYSGPFVGEAPDLLVNFAPEYRVSWQTPLGGVPAELFEDNVKKWSGDHVIDPSLVAGVLFVNRPFDRSDPGLEDLAPTILSALGVPEAEAMEGKSLI